MTASITPKDINLADPAPFEHSHVRISIGTMAEMQRATQVFREVLRPVVPSGGGGR